MTTQFNDLTLRPELMQAVAGLGYVEPTPIQAALIPVMLTGVDEPSARIVCGSAPVRVVRLSPR